jgi:hypothetical protein
MGIGLEGYQKLALLAQAWGWIWSSTEEAIDARGAADFAAVFIENRH